MLLDEETCELLAKKGIPIVTTFTICELVGEMLLSQNMTRQYEKLLKVKAKYGENIKMARAFGVSIATGTDICGCYPLDHGKNALELMLLHKLAGMSSMEAIQAATSVAAKAIRLGERIGVIRDGYDADLIILAKNPLDDLERFLNPNDIRYVLRKGRIAHQAFS